MGNIVKTKSEITNNAIFSEDLKHRYYLERCWDEDKPKVAIILLNPSDATELYFDVTTMKFMNYILNKELYGGIYFLNLYSYRDKANKDVLAKIREGIANTNESDEYIKKGIESSDLIYLGFGRAIYNDIHLHKNRLLEIKEILLSSDISKDNIFITTDGEGLFTHPVTSCKRKF